MQSARYFCQILTKYKIPRQNSMKVLNIKFHGNVSSGSRVSKCGQTDGRANGRDEAHSRLSRLCERAVTVYIIYFRTKFCFQERN
jgi:hypothetical protein